MPRSSQGLLAGRCGLFWLILGIAQVPLGDCLCSYL